MRVEWDERKDILNQRKHGVSFQTASLVFEDKGCVIYLDRSPAIEEQRFYSIGAVPIEQGKPRCCWSSTRTGRISMAKKSSASSQPERLVSMSSEDIKRKPWTEAERNSLRAIAEKQAAGDDSDIDFSDIPPLTEEQLSNMIRFRDFRRKVPVSVRLDPEVLDWLRSKGEGHLTRINDILTNLMEAEQKLGRAGTRC